jgi:hypothetical protein
MRRMLAMLFVAVAVLVFSSGPAGAVVTGDCTATIEGVDIGPLSATDPADAVEVDNDQDITVEASAPGGIDHYKIQLEFAGIRWTVAKGDVANDSWSKVVKVSDYSRYGVGVYSVRGVSTGASSCTGAALVKVSGNPFTTVAGIAGTVLTVAGAAGIASATLRARRAGQS